MTNTNSVKFWFTCLALALLASLFNMNAAVASDLSPNKYQTFRCALSADFGEMDAPLKKDFTPISKSENYMQTAEHFDLKVAAMYDEAGQSYSVEAVGANSFHIKTTLPYLADADLRFFYEFSDKSGRPVGATEFVVKCEK